MTKDDVRRMATSDGAILVDSARLANAADRYALSALAMQSGMPFAAPRAAPPVAIFEPEFWAARGELEDVSGGRGAAWFIMAGGGWVLRHSRRGGFVGHLSTDGYLWAGEARVRVFAEWRLLAELTARGLPVPAPIAARYVRRGFLYRCDLITERIAGARPLSGALALAALDECTWRSIGATIARLHSAGADHADLNAHNILLDAAGRVSVIDFDRGRLRTASSPGRPARWAARNLSRLHHSLAKIACHLPPERCSSAAWQWLLTGYADAPAHVSA